MSIIYFVILVTIFQYGHCTLDLENLKKTDDGDTEAEGDAEKVLLLTATNGAALEIRGMYTS